MSAVRAGAVFEAGSFTVTTGTGSKTLNHGLGVTPKALIVFETGNGSENATTGNTRFMVGFTDSTTTRTIGYYSLDGSTSPAAARLVGTDLIALPSNTTNYEHQASFTSWNSTSVTINVATSPAGSRQLNYLLIGGDGVSAKVVEWTFPNSTGNKDVTGFGFQPDAVITLYSRVGATTKDNINTDAGFGIGVLDASGDAWTATLATQHKGAVANTDTARYFRSDKALASVSHTATNAEATFQSLLADGVRLNFSVAPASAGLIASLGLKGVNVKAGTFSKSSNTTVPVDQSVSFSEFLPAALLLASVGATSHTTLQTHAGFAMGVATSGTARSSMTIFDRHNVATSDADKRTTSSDALIMQETTGAPTSTAELKQFDSGGFTFTWNANTSTQSVIGYLALGPLSATAATVESMDARPAGGGVDLRWRTATEVENLGFHVHRDDGGGRQRVTTALVPGNGLFAASPSWTRGRAYRYWDPRPAGPGTRYWIEDVSLSGDSRWHGPGIVVPFTSSRAPSIAAPLALEPGPDPEAPRPLWADGRPPRARGALSERMMRQAGLAAGAGAKLLVRRTGWYRVHRKDLMRAGFDTGACDPRALRLFADGEEQAILVSGGEDGRFDAEDAVEFYGVGEDSPWTDTRVYWLVVGPGRGKRIERREATSARSEASWFWHAETWRPRSLYFAALRNGETDNFFGPVIRAEEVRHAVAVHDLVPTEPAVLEVSVQGVTELPHEVSVALDGTEVGRLKFVGRTAARQSFTVRAGRLREGGSALVLRSHGGEQDVSLVHEVNVTYARHLRARDHAILFDLPAWTDAHLSGFAGEAPRVFDVSIPSAVRAVGATVQADGGVHVSSHRSGPSRLLAVAEAAVRTPDVQGNRGSDWRRGPSRRVDLLMVGPRALLSAVAPLRAARERQGLTVDAVDIDDVYDEFSFGQKSPQALRQLLRQARRWAGGPPGAVLLVGDASLDPRNHLGLGVADHVPTWMTEAASLETASDDWFADLDEDGLADIPIGRLPVRDASEATAVAEKLASYRPVAPRQAWPGVVLVADADPKGRFEQLTGDLRRDLPAAIPVQEIFRREAGSGISHAIDTALATGPLLIDYQGHGSVEGWAGGALSSARVPQAPAGARLPLVLAMTCLNGFFHDVYTTSLGEALLRAERGGAIGVVASSALPAEGASAELNRALIRLLLRGVPLGEALMRAKRGVEGSDLRRTTVLLGDPTLALVERPVPIAACSAGRGRGGVLLPYLLLSLLGAALIRRR